MVCRCFFCCAPQSAQLQRLTMGREFPIVSSTKQKLNPRSSTESELVGDNDMMPIIVWICYFMMAQGYGVTQNLMLQDKPRGASPLTMWSNIVT